jgi:flagellin
MAQVIGTNVASLNAQRNLDHSQGALATSLQRLSSGLRINSARDDAAGLAISQRMTAQIRGLNQAARNANDGISLAQTAEGALGEIGNNLQRLRELAVQSANGTNSSSDRSSLQAEANQLTAEITRVASQTQFNGLNLLDSSFTAANFQVGSNANQTISVSSIADSRASALGSHTLVGNSASGTAGTGSVIAGVATSTLSINGVTSEANLTMTVGGDTTSAISYAVSSSAKTIAAALQAAGAGLGVTATATNSTTLSGLAAPGTVSFELFGTDTSAVETPNVSAVIADQNDLSNLVSAINGVQGATGITAAFTNTGSKASITLSTTDGRNIGLGNFLNSGAGVVSFGGQALTSGGADSSIATGTVSIASTKGALTVASSNGDVFAATASSFVSVSALDLSTAAGAQAAIASLDSALSQVNVSRGDLGAYQNRFTSAIANLQTTSENVAAARSRIQDADFAAETAGLTRNQILQQAGIAMLAQANAVPQQVLTLLRG